MAAEAPCQTSTARAPESSTSTERSSNEPGGENWWLYRPKNRILQGSLDGAFQIFLRHRDRLEDPISIPLCCEWIPYHCVPHCGVYGASDYQIAYPLGLIELPSDELINKGALFHVLPKEMQHYLTCNPVNSSAEVDVLMIFHSLPSFESSTDPTTRHVNVMFHMWALKGVDLLSTPEVHITVEMGGFSPVGAEEAPPICEAEQLNGLPINRMGPRILYVHDLSFSPHNAQVALMSSHQLHAFFSMGRMDNGRTAITYHILPSSQEAERLLAQVTRSSNHTADLTKLFVSIEQTLEPSSHEQSTTCIISHTMSLLFQAACGHL